MPQPSDLPSIEPDVTPLMGGTGLPDKASGPLALDAEPGAVVLEDTPTCLLYTSPSPRD